MNFVKFFWGLCAFFICLENLQAQQELYWRSSTLSNWNNPLNWSNVSPTGPACNCTPGVNDIAYFDPARTGSCDIDVNVNVASIGIRAGYTGTINQNIFSIRMDASQHASGFGFDMADGIFNGSNTQDIRIEGGTSAAFTLSGGVFNSTGKLLFIGGHYSKTAGTFNHMNGTVEFNMAGFGGSASANLFGSTIFHKLFFTPGGNTKYFDIDVNTILTAQDTLYLYGAARLYFRFGKIYAKGDVVLRHNWSAGVTSVPNRAEIVICGTTDQCLDGGPDILDAYIINVTIDKPSGDLIIKGYVNHLGTWTHAVTNNANIIGTGTVVFFNENTIVGDHTLPNAYFYKLSSDPTIPGSYSINPRLTVADSLRIYGNNRAYFYGGEIHAKKDIFITDAVRASIFNNSTTNLYIDGTTDQHIYGYTQPEPPGPHGGWLPNVIINKSSGKLTMVDTIGICGNFEYRLGDVDAISNSPQIRFMNNNKTIDGLDINGNRLGLNAMVIHDRRALLGDIGAVDNLVFREGGSGDNISTVTAVIELNSNSHYLENPSPSAIVYDLLGYFISETSPALGYGKVYWNINGASVGNSYQVPFRTTANASVPVIFELQQTGTPSGVRSYLSFATYPTNTNPFPNNLPWPTGVTNTKNFFGVDNSCKLVDRYWIIGCDSFSTLPLVDVTFSYRESEMSGGSNCIDEDSLKLQQWNSSTSQWDIIGGTIDPVNNKLTISGIEPCGIFTLVDPQEPELNFSPSDTLLCVGDSVIFTAAYGVLPDTIRWDFPGGTPSSSTDSMPVVVYNSPGTYDVTVEVVYSGGGTINTTRTDLITVVPAISTNLAVTDISCNGADDGAIDLTPGDGTGNYEYLWNNPGNATTQDISALAPGTYTVQISDSTSSCTAVDSAIVTEPSPIIITVDTIIDVTCNGECTGSITVTATGGTPPFTYAWSNGQSGPTATNLCADDYDVTVTDGNGCTAVETITVNEPPVLTATLTGDQLTGCLCDGDATVTPNGGTPPYTHSWSHGPTTATVTNLCPGTYSDTITDANLCDTVITFTVTGPSPLVVFISNSSNVTCNGLCDGSATVDVSGGLGPYTVLWGPTAGSQTTLTVNNLCAGTHCVTVTDDNSCDTVVCVTITEPDILGASITDTTHVACNGDSTGSATVTATGGTPPYEYIWSSGDDSSTAIGLWAGTHSVTVSDSLGCDTIVTVTITEPPSLVLVVDTVIHVACNGDSTGSITVSATGGTGSYDFLWGGGQNTATISGLAAGNYSVTVTDDLGCTAEGNITVTEPPLLSANVDDLTHVDCNGECTGSITVSGVNGSPPYTYLWSANAGGQITPTVNGLCADMYMVTVTDANMCDTVVNVTVTEPSLLTINVDTIINVECTGECTGSITVSGNGGTPPYDYLWGGSQTTATINGLCSGNYDVTVTDSLGCDTSMTITITEPPLLQANINSSTDLACNNVCEGTATVTPSGGTPPYSYSWSNGDTGPTADSLCADTVTVIITDSLGCSAFDTVIISEPFLLTISVDSIKNESCGGDCNGVIIVNGIGGTPPYSYLWSHGPVTDTVSGLCADTFSVTITDANGCSISDTIIITSPPVLLAPVSNVINVSCNGECTGSVTIGPQGGTPPYDYLWSTADSGVAMVDSLCAGTYTVTVTDVLGCDTVTTVTITEPSVLTVTIDSVTHVACNGQCTGTATANPGGGTAPYSYNWSNGDNTSTADSLCAGNYRVTVTDSLGCQMIDSITISEPASLVLVIDTVIHVLCNGDSTGSITVSATGGTPPYNFAWGGGQNTATIAGLGAGNYSVTVTDSLGCKTNGNITVTEPPLLTATIDNLINVNCNGACTGSITVTGGGGTPPYSYLWSSNAGNATTSMIDSLCADTYMVTVRDANMCDTVLTIAIMQPPLLTILIDTVVHVNCFGECTGSITVIGNGGTPPYDYLWSGAQTTATIGNLCAGNYDVTITDSLGCDTSMTITINEPPLMEATISSSTNLICNGECIGTASVTPSGGTPPYSYDWSNGDTSPAADSLCADTVTVIVTDSLGCQAFDTVIITEPPVLSITTSTITNASCGGDCDGIITITPIGGVGPYAIQWDANANSQTGATANNLCAGDYVVTVTDSLGCSTRDTLTITEPPVLLAPVSSVTHVACFGDCTGEATVSPVGGNPPYQYDWSNGDTIATADSLCAGTYTVTVSDSLGCDTVTTITITQPSLLGASITDTFHVACFGDSTGTATVTATGGTPPYSYNWTNGDTVPAATGLWADTFSVTVTDSLGCDTTVTVIITEPPVLMISVDAVVDVACNGICTGTITVSGSGGTPSYTYMWSNGQSGPTASNLCAGDYGVTITDASGCTISDTVTINEPPILSYTVNDTSNVFCNGECTGVIWVTGIGGTPPYTYNWQHGATGDSLSGLCAGSYTVTITDSLGCDTVVVFNITEPLSLTATIAAADTTHVSCNGLCDGSATVTPSGELGPYSFIWSNSDTGPTADSLCAGTYSVSVIDANNCDTVVVSVTITEPPVLTAIISDTVHVDCNGNCTGSAIVTPSGGTPPYGFTWSDGQSDSTAGNLCAGNYTVTVMDAMGCDTVVDLTITEPAVLIASITDSSNVSCFRECDGSATVTATGGTSPYIYRWDNAETTATATGLCAGTSCVTVTDDNGCDTVVCVTITQPDSLILTIVVDSNASCYAGAADGGLTVGLTGGTPLYDYLWSGGVQNTTDVPDTSNTVAGLASGPYTVTVTDENGCEQIISANIGERESPGLDTIIVEPAKCNRNDGSITLVNVTTFSNSPAYMWQGSSSVSSVSNFADSLFAGTYAVTITDQISQCDTTFLNIIVDNIPGPVIQVDTKDAFCGNEDGEATVIIQSGGTPPFTYEWSHIGFDDSIVTDLSPSPFYSVTVSDAYNCTASDLYQILDIASPDASITILNLPFTASPVTVYEGQRVELKANSNVQPIGYLWTPDEGIDCTDCDTVNVTPASSTTYQLIVLDSATGCIDTALMTIIVKDDQNIFIPNVITPNGDGINDQWVISELQEIFPNHEVKVVTRWGDEVFTSNDYQNDWDGTYNNSKLPDGTYYYIIKLNNIDKVVSGTVTIINE